MGARVATCRPPPLQTLSLYRGSHFSYDRITTGPAPFTQTEQEIIVLRAVWDMIDGMVNYKNFGREHETVEAQVMFNTGIHQRLFNIDLVDFLSRPP